MPAMEYIKSWNRPSLRMFQTILYSEHCTTGRPVPWWILKHKQLCFPAWAVLEVLILPMEWTNVEIQYQSFLKVLLLRGKKDDPMDKSMYWYYRGHKLSSGTQILWFTTSYMQFQCLGFLIPSGVYEHLYRCTQRLIHTDRYTKIYTHWNKHTHTQMQRHIYTHINIYTQTDTQRHAHK